MEAILSNLGQIFLSLEVLPAGATHIVPTFVIASMIMGVLVVLLDLCFYNVTSRGSFLKIRHSWKSTPVMLFFWSFGAGLFSFFGLIAHIIQPTLFGCAAAGVTWTLAIERTIRSFNPAADGDEVAERDA